MQPHNGFHFCCLPVTCPSSPLVSPLWGPSSFYPSPCHFPGSCPCSAVLRCPVANMVGEQCSVLQDPTLRPSLKDVDEQLTQLSAEQSVVNETLAETRKRDQALLEQMLPPQVLRPHCFPPLPTFHPPVCSPLCCLLPLSPVLLAFPLVIPFPVPRCCGSFIPPPNPCYRVSPVPQDASFKNLPTLPPPLTLSPVLICLPRVFSHVSFIYPPT